jgi:molecular chaperone DnaJ
VPAGDGGTVKVKIPAGVADRAKIKVKGKGQPGPAGGQPGDLYVRVHVADHPLYRREGSNLRIAVPVTYTEAALGAEIDVPTIDGKVTLRIPHGTTGEKTLRVRGQGFTDPDGSRGDLLVSIDVQVPAHLTTEEEKLLRELRELERDRNPRSHLGV